MATSTTTGQLIIVSGAPGAGKSTVAKRLVAASDRAVLLVGDDLWAAIERGGIAPYLAEAQPQNETVMRALGAAAAEFAAGGYLVVLETVVGPWFLSTSTAAANDRGIAVHYVVLRPSLEVAQHRASGRPDDALDDEDVITELHRQFRDLGPYERHAIDTTALDVEQTVQRVVDGVTTGSFRVPPAGSSR